MSLARFVRSAGPKWEHEHEHFQQDKRRDLRKEGRSRYPRSGDTGSPRRGTRWPGLAAEAAKVAQPLNWRTSIVDLMKLLDIDSSLANRKELAQELGYTGELNGSAEMNIWLHKAVMRELAANGGKVPADLTD